MIIYSYKKKTSETKQITQLYGITIQNNYKKEVDSIGQLIFNPQYESGNTRHIPHRKTIAKYEKEKYHIHNYDNEYCGYTGYGYIR